MKTTETSSDIICSMAQREKAGAPYWIEHLWSHSDGTYSICDSDGNHDWWAPEEVDAYVEEASQSWVEYAAFVRKTGTDPLGNYLVERETKKVEKWTVRLRYWIGASTHGLAIVSARRGAGKSITPAQFPPHLAEFLDMKRTGAVYYCSELYQWGDIVCGKIGGKGQPLSPSIERPIHIEVERKTPRPDKVIRKELIALASRP